MTSADRVRLTTLWVGDLYRRVSTNCLNPWWSLINAYSMLYIITQNMGLLCSRQHRYNEADTAQVSYKMHHLYYSMSMILVILFKNLMISLFYVPRSLCNLKFANLILAFPGCRNRKANWTRNQSWKAYSKTSASWYKQI